MVQYDIDGSIEDDKEFVKEQLRVVYVDYMEYTVEIHRVGDPAKSFLDKTWITHTSPYQKSGKQTCCRTCPKRMLLGMLEVRYHRGHGEGVRESVRREKEICIACSHG